jgi:lysozyme
MNRAKIEDQLITHEGERLVLYRCTAGKSSIGIGHNLTDNGITQEMSRFIFGIDLQECIIDLSQRVFLGQFEDFPEDIQHVLINMRFQLGHTGFRNFKKIKWHEHSRSNTYRYNFNQPGRYKAKNKFRC